MWAVVENKLTRTFQFGSFVEAWGFMSKIALIAERMNHHPEWTNVYNQVEIKLSTHDAGDIVTKKDHELAQAIDQLLH
ncbi:4a-hydroxytetrahydrobiopterin dehydratase [Solitalea sp. MAHUQ-68]|uniref:4a-hydroxytetrahydrobiopterin dehydratase n=1 Tax=Solitalea agri TaxID=2953739 RepID=A0A9X2F260_9SPHI|nr:4a-hydroxytetrahydrobiopterin dehydratase [Solitalea agri]MCO4292836.1 4a-hydroxytetrahydrobiopterin dehydratase [Solitalea agri]